MINTSIHEKISVTRMMSRTAIFQKLKRYYSLTFTGTATLITATILSIPAWYSSDIVATGISLSIFITLFIFILGSLLVFKRLQSSLTIEVALPTTPITSEDPGVITFTISGVKKLLPGFEIELAPILSPEELPLKPYARKLVDADRGYIQFILTPPHRGVWKLTECVCTVRDILRLTAQKISIPLSQEITIHIPHTPLPALPLYASSSHPGDTVIHNAERLGDPFDLRPYQPGDSMKRILWKVYARTGELITRQPEASCTPEGEMWIFCAAKKHADATASACLDYARQAIRSNLTIHAGCIGMGSRKAATSIDELEKLLIDATWESDEESPAKSLDRFLQSAPCTANQKH